MAAANAAAESTLRLLEMLGMTGVNVDIPALNGDLYAIRSVLIGEGLVTLEEFEATAAEGRAAFLRQLVTAIQAAKQQSARKLLSS